MSDWDQFKLAEEPKDTKATANDWDQFKLADSEQPSVGRKLLGALEHGASTALEGASHTAEDTLGPGVVSRTLHNVADSVRPYDYTPASQGLYDTSKGILERASNVPQAIAEGAPGAASDVLMGGIGGAMGGAVGGPVGAALGGISGAGASYLARSYGDDAKARAVSRTGDPNAEPEWRDKLRAIVTGVASGTLNRLGFQGATSAAPGIFGRTAAGALSGAASNVAQGGIHANLIEGKNPSIDQMVTDAAVGGAAGGLTGATTKAIDTGVDNLQSHNAKVTFADIDPVVGGRVAARLKDADVSTPKKSFDALTKVERDISSETNRFTKDVQPLLKHLKENSGFTDDTQLALDKVRTQLKAGAYVPSEELEPIRQAIGSDRQGANLVNALEEHSSLNKIKEAGVFDTGRKTFGGGLSSSHFVQDATNPLRHPMHTVGYTGNAALGLHAIAHANPLLSLALPATQMALGAGARGIDNLTGARTPLKGLSRAVDATGPVDTSGLPDFRHEMLKQRMASKGQSGGQPKGQPKNTQAGNVTEGPSSDALSVNYGDQKVERSTEGVSSKENYSRKILNSLKVRNRIIGDVHGALGERLPEVETLLHRLNNNANSEAEARDALRTAMERSPPKVAEVLGKLVDKPEMWATWKK